MLYQAVAYVKARESADEGATMVEYGIMVALIAAISIGVITIIGTDVLAAFDKVEKALPAN